MTRRYLGTITEKDYLSKTLCPARGVLGYIQRQDIGKQYFDVKGTTQVENNEQRDRRLGVKS